MINLNPQSLSLIASAASGLISAVPKAHLARFGLVRAPLAAPLAVSTFPVAAAAGGALVVALIVPSSRRWLVSKATSLTTAVRSKMLENRGADEDRDKPISVTDVANRRAKAQGEKSSPRRKPSVA